MRGIALVIATAAAVAIASSSLGLAAADAGLACDADYTQSCGLLYESTQPDVVYSSLAVDDNVFLMANTGILRRCQSQTPNSCEDFDFLPYGDTKIDFNNVLLAEVRPDTIIATSGNYMVGTGGTCMLHKWYHHAWCGIQYCYIIWIGMIRCDTA
jgi:hypothetical protein